MLLWLKSRLYSRQSGTGANVRYLAGNLNFCKSGYAANPPQSCPPPMTAMWMGRATSTVSFVELHYLFGEHHVAGSMTAIRLAFRWPDGLVRALMHSPQLASGCKAVKLTAARLALQVPALNPQAVESAQAFMARVAKVDVALCPCCKLGRLTCRCNAAGAAPLAGSYQHDASTQPGSTMMARLLRRPQMDSAQQRWDGCCASSCRKPSRATKNVPNGSRLSPHLMHFALLSLVQRPNPSPWTDSVGAAKLSIPYRNHLW